MPDATIHLAATKRSIKPSKDIYFLDGTIVLIASNTAFKVHQFQLARHSEMFRDLFDVVSKSSAHPKPISYFNFPPAAPSASTDDSDPNCESLLPSSSPSTRFTCWNEAQLYDGVPWIELHDSQEDLAIFLGALYDGLYPPSAPSSIKIIGSTLLLSHKYIVPHLHHICIERLVQDWPLTLEGWDARERQCTQQVKGVYSGIYGTGGKYNPRERTCHPIEVVQVVMGEVGVNGFDDEDTGRRILSTTLYDLSRYGPSRIATSVLAVPELHRVTPSNSEWDTTGLFDSPILLKALRGRQECQKYMASFIQRELHGREPSTNCVYRPKDFPISSILPHLINSQFTPQACRESFYFIMLNLLRSIGGIAMGRDADPLFTLGQAVDMMERRDFCVGGTQNPEGTSKPCGLKICIECKAEFRECVEKAREVVWREMVGWFGLD